MKTQIQILLLVSVAIIVACGFSANQKEIISDPAIDVPEGIVYANEFGQIELVQLNDTLMQTIFSDNEKIVFDTVMKINYNYSLLPKDSFPLLQLSTSGIKIFENRLEVHDFAGPAYMQMYASIEHIYDRPFYKMNENITISDVVKTSKDGNYVNGIYLFPNTKYENEFVHLTGTITKEKYPRAYYSTPDGPQGMFSDTNEIHYRLVVKDYKIDEVKKEVMTGRTMNIDGRAAFIWDYADSEAYYLDGHKQWTQEELDKKITIEAVLVQFIDGKSVLKAWTIIE